ncbi:MAG TPA: F0F1 ATP synthase subunit alpha, partial [Candidatus Nocardiopsis merdipullorum]|nr:F0F1 ATP synthase subunit alpha [Candidatus Nocardiopsis merdipullorum]
GARMMELLKQGQYSPYPMEDTVVSIWAGTSGHVDEVPVEDVRRFEEDFLSYLKREHKGVLDNIRESGKFEDETAKSLEEAIEKFKQGFQTSAGTLLGQEAEPEALEEEKVGQETIKVAKGGK